MSDGQNEEIPDIGERIVADESDTNGRESNGRFGSGNQFSKGRKRQDKFRNLFDKCVSENDFKAVVKSLVDQAIGGDVHAAKLILERCMGKETDKIELDVEQRARVVLYFPDDGRETIPA